MPPRPRSRLSLESGEANHDHAEGTIALFAQTILHDSRSARTGAGSDA